MIDTPPAYPYESDFKRFLQCLSRATPGICDKYMLLPIDGLPLPIYRERVYCYELYHQLRLRMGDDFGYYLGGEVDKLNHPRMLHPTLQRAKPDLLVHDPGRMEGNLVVMEVKPVKSRVAKIATRFPL